MIEWEIMSCENQGMGDIEFRERGTDVWNHYRGFYCRETDSIYWWNRVGGFSRTNINNLFAAIDRFIAEERNKTNV